MKKKNKNLFYTVVKYKLKNTSVYCYITLDYISIIDSFKITDEKDMLEILNNLLKDYHWYRKTRTIEDMIYEWKAHNILYDKYLFRKHTRNVDFEVKQNKFLKYLYRVFVKMYEEFRWKPV